MHRSTTILASTTSPDVGVIGADKCVANFLCPGRPHASVCCRPGSTDWKLWSFKETATLSEGNWSDYRSQRSSLGMGVDVTNNRAVVADRVCVLLPMLACSRFAEQRGREKDEKAGGAPVPMLFVLSEGPCCALRCV